jgi:hypothetical protein
MLIIGLLLVQGQMQAQETPKKKEKKEKVVIIHESDEGEERQEIIIQQIDGEDTVIKIDGEEIEISQDFEWIEEEVELEIEKAMKQVEVELKKLDSLNTFHFQFTDENGEEQSLHWEGVGDLPEEIREELRENGVFMHEGKNLFFDSDEDVNIVIDGDGAQELIIIKEDSDSDEELRWIQDKEQPTLELQNYEAFPNPASDNINIRFDGNEAPITLRVLDTNGKTVYKEKLKKFDGHYERSIGLKGIPDGTLLIMIEQEGKAFTDKVLLKRM